LTTVGCGIRRDHGHDAVKEPVDGFCKRRGISDDFSEQPRKRRKPPFPHL
jgi:hypothetical protein